MMYRNSFKILLSNFVNVWKVLIYKIVIFAIVLGITATFTYPVIIELISAGFFDSIVNVLQNSFMSMSLSGLLSGINNVFSGLLNCIYAFSSQLITLTIVGAVVLVVLSSFFNGLYELAMTEHISGIMSSNVKFGFSNCFATNFGKSFRLQVARLFINLPLSLIIISAFFLSLNLLTVGGMLGLFAPLLIVISTVILVSLKLTYFAGWLPAIVVHDANILKGLHIGIVAVKKRFWRTLSSNICLVISIMIVNLFALFFTAGAGLIITLPASSLLIIIFDLVMYYGSNGMRYYVDSDTILAPKKLEEQDNINRTKYLI